MIDVEGIRRNVAAVRERIEGAAKRAGRDPSRVRLVAVSKMHSVEVVRAAHAAGVRDFGENYVQHLVAKADACADLDGIVWHAIGHVQTNKARDVARVAHCVHTIDTPKLAAQLARKSEERGRTLDALVQVNVGGEAQKSGCAPADVPSVIEAIRREPALRLRGLMTVPPHTEDPEGAAPFFRQLVALRDAHGGRDVLPDLSMGMTHDLEVAVREGATIVRVGTAIFGERD